MSFGPKVNASAPSLGGASTGSVSSVFSRTGAITAQTGDYTVTQVTGAAPLASPTLSGTPTAPTPSPGDNDTSIATSAFVTAAVGVETTRAEAAETLLAPKASPALTGTPTVPTAALNTNTTQAASTAFVLAQAATATPIIDGTATVGTSTTFARADHVHPTDTSRAALASPALTGTPTAPTATPGTNTTQLATTAFVTAAVGGGGSVSSVFGRSGVVVATSGDYTVSQITGAAPLASPTLTGTPAAPTASAGTNTTQVATTAFVIAELGLPIGLTGATAATRDVGGTSSGAPVSGTFVLGDVAVAQNAAIWVCTTGGSPGTWTSVTAGLATLASPTFTGTPAAPTATVSTNTTQLATTAFVLGQVGTATPLINGTAAVGTSLLYARQDHVHPTDTTRAALASPTFTGTPAAPTASAATSTTQIATTAFVQAATLAPIVQSVTSTSSFAILSTSGFAKLTALAAACTFSISGTPSDGQKLTLRIKDAGSSETLTFSATNFASSGVATLPTATTAGKTMHFEFIYDSVLTKYVLLALDSVGY